MQLTRDNIRSIIDEIMHLNKKYRVLPWDQLVTFVNARNIYVRNWDFVRAVLQEYVDAGKLRQTNKPGVYKIT